MSLLLLKFIFKYHSNIYAEQLLILAVALGNIILLLHLLHLGVSMTSRASDHCYLDVT